MSLPRIHSHPNPYAAVSTSDRRDSINSTSGPRRSTSNGLPRFLKRLFKFPQMDFEVAIWEMVNLMVAPRKVVRNLYYQKRASSSHIAPHAA